MTLTNGFDAAKFIEAARRISPAYADKVADLIERLETDGYHDGATKRAAARHGLTPDEYEALRDAGKKWCRACKEWQNLSDFRPSTSTRDGVRPLCTRHYAPRSATPINHGRIGGYRRGCRCRQCKDANNQAQYQAKARRKADPARADRAGHGKASTYGNYGCRCPACTAAQSVKNAAQHKARKERQTP